MWSGEPDESLIDPVHRRAAVLLREQKRKIAKRADLLFASLMLLEWLAGIALAYWFSASIWSEVSDRIPPHDWDAPLFGTRLVLLSALVALTRPGTILTRHTLAVAQMLMGGMLIQLTGGRLETRFIVFAALAFLTFYRDWPVLVTASAVVIADNLLRGVLWPQSVYGVLAPPPWKLVEHAAWVIFIDVFLIAACRQATREIAETALRQAQ